MGQQHRGNRRSDQRVKKNQQHQQNQKPGGGGRKKFEYGNYNRYYGYRHPDHEELDERLRHFDPDWLSGRDCLDVGCNVGRVTAAAARLFRPRSMVGMDIDRRLVAHARKNLSAFASCYARPPPSGEGGFPRNLPLIFGPLEPPGGVPKEDEEGEQDGGGNGDEAAAEEEEEFPRNVT